VGRKYIAVPCRVIGVLDSYDQFIVESSKRALGMEAKGKKRLLWGDNSITAVTHQMAKLG
jgi:hypothetical protein